MRNAKTMKLFYRLARPSRNKTNCTEISQIEREAENFVALRGYIRCI